MPEWLTERIANPSASKAPPGFESLSLRRNIESFTKLSGCSVARLSRLLWEQEAAGSNPATPTKPADFQRVSFFADNMRTNLLFLNRFIRLRQVELS